MSRKVVIIQPHEFPHTLMVLPGWRVTRVSVTKRGTIEVSMQSTDHDSRFKLDDIVRVTDSSYGISCYQGSHNPLYNACNKTWKVVSLCDNQPTSSVHATPQFTNNVALESLDDPNHIFYTHTTRIVKVMQQPDVQTHLEGKISALEQENQRLLRKLEMTENANYNKQELKRQIQSLEQKNQSLKEQIQTLKDELVRNEPYEVLKASYQTLSLECQKKARLITNIRSIIGGHDDEA